MSITFNFGYSFADTDFGERIMGDYDDKTTAEMEHIFGDWKPKTAVMRRVAWMIQAALTAKKGEYVILEYPEAGLHPVQQIQLMDVLVKSKGDLILISHSEIMLQRTEQLVRLGKVEANDVFVHYETRSGEHIHLIIKPNGYLDGTEKLENFGGFFEEGYKTLFSDDIEVVQR
jgi:hypothetical protein